MKAVLLYISICLFLSCATEPLTETFKSSLTVEGFIEPQKFARIYLTKSLPVIGKIDSLDIIDAIETTAKVELFSSKKSEILTLKKDENRFPFFYYRSNLIIGEINEVFNLKITINNIEYESSTYIPLAPIILANNFQPAKTDSLRKLNIDFEKNHAQIKFYKCLIKKPSDNVYTKANPFIFNDSLILSNTFEVSFLYDKIVNGEFKNQMKIGDTIECKISSITKEEYVFWKSITGDQTTLNNDILFTQNTPTNISGYNVFGFWSGENTIKETLIVK